MPYSEISSDEEDEELRLACEKGLLKPGLNKIIEKKLPSVNNVAGLERKKMEIDLKLPWIEELVLTCNPAPLAPELALQLEEAKSKPNKLAQDDFAREMHFYRLGQAAVLEGIPKLHKLNIKTKRPDDFLAEMAKSDDHMHKVRKVLVSRKAAVQVKETRQRIKLIKKTNKQLQAEKRLKKQQEKKNILNRIKKYRKGNKNVDLDFLEKPNERLDDDSITLKEDFQSGASKRGSSNNRNDRGFKKKFKGSKSNRFYQGGGPPSSSRGGRNRSSRGRGKGKSSRRR